MQIYLIRHADAEPLAPPITSDDERPLTPAGIKQCRRLAQALAKAEVKLDRVFASPLLRARQTAEEMLRHWDGAAPELIISEALAPDAKSKKRKRFFLSLDGEAVGIVGHQPRLGEWTAWLIGSKKAQLDLAKAGIAFVDCPEGPNKGMGSLQLLVTPEWYS